MKRRGVMMRRAHIIGWGSYVPSRVLTNDDLAHMVDTSDEWIRTRTGIRERRIASLRESTATMAVEAARAALRVAGLSPAQLDLIIVATATPDYAFPSTACLVQDALGANGAAAFDLAAGCTGFVYALGLASDLIAAGKCDHALVIGAETLSRILNWEDRTTCILFGDGAGAVVLRAGEAPGGVLSYVLGADGSGAYLLILPAGGSRCPASPETVAQGLHYVRMRGREIFRFAIRTIPRVAREAVEKAGLDIEHVELLIPHQANLRIIESAAETLGIPRERVFVNIDRYGNTSAASIPIALCEALEQGKVKGGDHLVLVGFGAGLTWGAAVIEWSVPLPVPSPPLRKRLWFWLRYRWSTLRSLWRRLWRRLRSLLW